VDSQEDALVFVFVVLVDGQWLDLRLRDMANHFKDINSRKCFNQFCEAGAQYKFNLTHKLLAQPKGHNAFTPHSDFVMLLLSHLYAITQTTEHRAQDEPGQDSERTEWTEWTANGLTLHTKDQLNVALKRTAHRKYLTIE